MKKFSLTVLFVLTAGLMYSQSLYLNSGKNMTKYNFQTSNGENAPKLVSGSGNYYELGYETPLFKESQMVKSLSYRGGVSLNQFNASGGDAATQVAWKTNYLGLQNTLGYCFLQTNKVPGLKVFANLGLNLATIIQGDQIVNNVYYNLANNNEFKGLFLQPSAGLDLRYNVSDVFDLNLKYNFSRAYNVTTTAAENLSFTNNQIALGISFPLYNSKAEQK